MHNIVGKTVLGVVSSLLCNNLVITSALMQSLIKLIKHAEEKTQ
jgi:hypothetical protein